MFGQTEANYIVGNCNGLLPFRPDCMGKAYPGLSVEVLDEGNRPCVAGIRGEISVRNGVPVMFLEYWNRPEATWSRFRREWMLTGNFTVGWRWIHLRQGRTDDIISSAVYRTGPGEIEQCLQTHPSGASGRGDRCAGKTRAKLSKFVQIAPGFGASESLAKEIQKSCQDSASGLRVSAAD